MEHRVYPNWNDKNTYYMRNGTKALEFINTLEKPLAVDFRGLLDDYVLLNHDATRICLCNPIVAQKLLTSTRPQTLEISDASIITREIVTPDPLLQRFLIYRSNTMLSLAEQAIMATVQVPDVMLPTQTTRWLQFKKQKLYSYWPGVANSSIYSCICSQ